MSQTWRDLRYALRSWRRQPGFTLTAIAIQAIGIASMAESGVVVDVCSAHGTWFDEGELPRVLAFVESYGHTALADDVPTPAADRRPMSPLWRVRSSAHCAVCQVMLQ